MGNNQSRGHHYLPQCYLKGFSKKKGKKSWQLQVIDVEYKTQFPATPKRVGLQRDFNRIDIEGVEPDALETSLSTFETDLAESLRAWTAGLPLRAKTKKSY